MRAILVSLALVSAAAAQGVTPLSSTMRFGTLGARFGGQCGPNTTPSVFAEEGTLAFRADGTLSAEITTYEVCPGGTATMSPPEFGTGRYDVRSDGVLGIEWLPANPGADADTLFLRADGAVAIRTRKQERSDDATVTIGVALSSNKGLASVAGTYHMARLIQQNPATGMSMVADLGTITFDGIGGYVYQVTRHTLPFGGTATTTSVGPNIGTYTVAGDGTMTTGIGASGAVSPDGEVFFWMRRVGTNVSMLVGLRQSGSYPTAMVAGDWRLAGTDNAIAASASPVELRTDWGTMRLQPTGVGVGSLTVDLVHLATSTTQTSATWVAGSDAFTLNMQGGLMLFTNGPTPMPGALSSDGSAAVALTVDGDSLGLTLGLSACAYPTTIGTATPGTGGRAPAVVSIGGFPYAGNTGFGLVVAGGRGGAPAALLIASDASAGVPFLGGTIWLDPNQVLVALSLQLSGPVGMPGGGAACMPLPVPGDPLLGGARLVNQVFVVDPGGPQGLAMSPALDVRLCR